MSLRRFTYLVSLLGVIAFLALNVLSERLLSGWRLDLTSAGLYTLSDTSKRVLKNVSEPIDLTLIYSRRVGSDYPDIRAHAARVEELLSEYRAASRGKVRLTIVDPDPFSEEEDRALAGGITPVSTHGVDPLYFGLLGRNAIDEEDVLPFLSPEQDTSLEYDITRMIARLDDPEPARIGILSALNGLKGDPAGAEAYSVLKDIAELYSIEPINADFYELPMDIDVLLIVHPPPLSDFQLYLIDQFLMEKGRALIALDPQAQASRRVGLLDNDIVEASYLGPLLEHWGVDLPTDVVVDMETALPVNVPDGTGRYSVVPQPLFFSPNGDMLSEEDAMTSPLERGINLGLAGWFEVSDDSERDWSTLVRTSDQIGRVSASIAGRTPDPYEVSQYLTALNGPVPLAIRRLTPLTTAFPGGSVSPDLPDDPVLSRIVEASLAGQEHLDASQGTPTLILMSDADIFDDGFYINPQSGQAVADNAVFILNAVETLTGAEGLSALRSRTPAYRPMVRVDQLRLAAQERLLEEQRRVETELVATEERLVELEALRKQTASQSDDLSVVAEIQAYREEVLALRERLRGIERDFRTDIDQLANGLRTFNIWSGVILISFFGLSVLFLKRQRERRA